VLREINQLSYEEIAAATGLKLGTVRSRINRARPASDDRSNRCWIKGSTSRRNGEI